MAAQDLGSKVSKLRHTKRALSERLHFRTITVSTFVTLWPSELNRLQADQFHKPGRQHDKSLTTRICQPQPTGGITGDQRLFCSFHSRPSTI